MTTQEIISRSSRFIVGVATTFIVFQAIAFVVLRWLFYDPTMSTYTIGGEYSINWIVISLGEILELVFLLLCGWIGQLLRFVYPSTSRGLQISLFIIALIGLVWYGFWISRRYWPSWNICSMMLCCAILSYLMPVNEIKPHNKAELMIMSIVMALFYAVGFGLTRHTWAQIPAALGFLFFIILLSRDPDVQNFMDKKWVKPTLIILSVLAFLITFRSLVVGWGLNMSYLCRLIVQPVIVYPVIWIWRKKHTNRVLQL